MCRRTDRQNDKNNKYAEHGDADRFHFTAPECDVITYYNEFLLGHPNTREVFPSNNMTSSWTDEDRSNDVVFAKLMNECSMK
jgi:hypothetical protein